MIRPFLVGSLKRQGEGWLATAKLPHVSVSLLGQRPGLLSWLLRDLLEFANVGKTDDGTRQS